MYHLKTDVYHFYYGYIRSRKSADGTVRYTAQIRVKCEGAQVYQESQIFAQKQTAQARRHRAGRIALGRWSR